LTETLRDDGISRVDFERCSQFFGGPGETARKGISFSSLGIEANQFRAQCRPSFDDGGILGRVMGSFIVARQCFLETPCCFGLVSGSLGALGIRADYLTLQLW